jgi:hypothetical protein
MPDAWSCSLSRYTDHLLTSVLRHLDFSKDFMEKGGFVHSVFCYTFLGVMLMRLNGWVLKRRPL